MSLREQILQAIFGQATLPTAPSAVQVGVPENPAGITAASRDKLVYTSSVGANNSYLYVPSSPVGKLLILHQGHDQGMGNLGISQLGQGAVNAGWHVLCCAMPGYSGNGGSSNHAGYTSLTPFIGHVHAALNAIAGQFTVIAMSGISGGGWTTTLCAALDPRIRCSFPVAGSLPNHLRIGTSWGDWEQHALDSICDYPALYALGAEGVGRYQRQILNRNDPACFAHGGNSGAYGDNYSVNVVQVVNAVASLDGGLFDWREDTSHPFHEISQWAREVAIYPVLGITLQNPSPPPLPPPPVAYDRTIDDGDVGFSLVGGVGNPNQGAQIGVWTPWTNQGVNSDVKSAPGGDGSLKARWEFVDAPAGTFEVSVSYTAYSNRGNNIPYVASNAGGNLLQTTVTQQGAFATVWRVLGSFTSPGGALTVEVTNAANGYVIADACRLRKI